MTSAVHAHVLSSGSPWALPIQLASHVIVGTYPAHSPTAAPTRTVTTLHSPAPQDYPWAQHANQTLADVGGGLGGILAAVLTKEPSMRGILFDRCVRRRGGRCHCICMPRQARLIRLCSSVLGLVGRAAPLWLQQLKDWLHCALPLAPLCTQQGNRIRASLGSSVWTQHAPSPWPGSAIHLLTDSRVH